MCIVNDITKNLRNEGEHDSYITPENLFDGLYRSNQDQGGAPNGWISNRWWMKTTGRYPTIPQVYAAPEGMQAFNKSSFNKSEFDAWMNDNFTAEYSGDIYAGRHENAWVTYNPYQYDETNDGTTRTCGLSVRRATGTIPFRYNTCESVALDYAPYTLGIMKEYRDKLTFYLTNYEGGKDIIQISGAGIKPTYTANTDNITDSWNDGVYILTVEHSGAAVELTVNCAGAATDRETDYTSATITVPALPDAYTGVLQYEAELADYKNSIIRKTGYNQGHDGYQGQGFAEMSNSGSALRFAVSVPKTGYYLLNMRYQADDNGSVSVGSDVLPIAATNVWTTAQTYVQLNEGEGFVVLQNTGGKKTYIDCITLESIKAETFTLDEKGEYHVSLGDLVAAGTVSFDASTGVVTQSTGSQNATGSLRLFLDHADFTRVTSLTVSYEGDGDIFKYLVVSDNHGHSANPAGSQGAFWSSKYSLNYTIYQQEEASQQVCKLEWTANAPASTERRMTIKDIVITGQAGQNSVEAMGRLPQAGMRYYTLQGQVVEKPGKGVYIMEMRDGKSMVKRYK